jgi:hypothetical protein
MTPRFTSIEESDAVVDRQPAVPSVPPPMFTDIVETEIVRYRQRVRRLYGADAAELVGCE